MKFDKETVIAFAICIVVLFGWDPLCKYMGWFQPVGKTASETRRAAEPERAGNATVPGEIPAAAAAEPLPAQTAAPLPEFSGPLPVLSNRHLQFVLDPVRGDIGKILLLQYENAARTAPVELDQSGGSSGALGIRDLRNAWVPLKILECRQEGKCCTLKRRMRTASGAEFELTQSFELGDGYITEVLYRFRNLSGAELRFDELVVNGGNVPSWKAISGDKVRIPSHRMDFMTADGRFTALKADAKPGKFIQDPPPTVLWAGAGNKYFVSLLAGEAPFVLYQDRNPLAEGSTREMILTTGARLSMRLAPEETKSVSFRFYAGPKVIAELDRFAPGAKRVMHLAWGPLDYLARLLLWALVTLHGWCGSYGVSIILLTLVVRLLFYPVTAKANASMKRMQAVQPKLQELREKYKDNPQLMSAKTMELYRTEKINPFGGCLPILLQIPVFFALYATLDGAVELRQVPFLWAHDLAAADTVCRIPLYFLDLPVNPLVLMMTALMVVQQRMTPMAMDPAQQKMMLAMPVVMLIFLYDLPSGLTLYWTVSNVFSIVQLRLQQRGRKREAEAAGYR